MLDEIVPLPEDPEELRAFTARLLAVNPGDKLVHGNGLIP